MKALSNGLKDKREDNIDIIRGIAICLIVLGHTASPLTHFVYLFHVSIFFILSGVCFKGNQDTNLYGVIRKKIKRLYIPYVVYNIFFVLLNNIFIYLGFYLDSSKKCLSDATYNVSYIYSSLDFVKEIIKILLFAGGSEICGPLWFLRSLFIVIVLYNIIFIICSKFKNNNTIIRVIVCFVISFFGFLCSKYGIILPFNILSSMTVLILIEIGYLLKKQIYKIESYSIVGLLAIILLILCNMFCNIDIGNNKYTSYFIFVLLSVAGYVFLYYVSKFIIFSSLLSDLFVWLGRNSLHIMALHFFAFKIVTFILIKVFNLNTECLALFPTIKQGWYWVGYWILGLFISCIITFGICMVKEKIMNKDE